MIEPLEQRTLFSWPNAPFSGSDDQGTIYANQYGEATLTGKVVRPGREFNGYATYFDDAGAVTFQALSKVPLDIAFYRHPGGPAQINATPGRNRSGTITAQTPLDKDTLYLGVQPHKGNPTGTYTLLMKGPAANVIRDIPISPDSNAGSLGGVITGTNDSDFVSFRVPRNGNWLVTMTPTAVRHPFQVPFDGTMNVYDGKGNPVGGTFTAPIDTGRRGADESWLGTNLRAGDTYYVRVDGRGDSLGRYRVHVALREKRRRKPRDAKPLANLPSQGMLPASVSSLTTKMAEQSIRSQPNSSAGRW